MSLAHRVAIQIAAEPPSLLILEDDGTGIAIELQGRHPIDLLHQYAALGQDHDRVAAVAVHCTGTSRDMETGEALGRVDSVYVWTRTEGEYSRLMDDAGEVLESSEERQQGEIPETIRLTFGGGL